MNVLCKYFSAFYNNFVSFLLLSLKYHLIALKYLTNTTLWFSSKLFLWKYTFMQFLRIDIFTCLSFFLVKLSFFFRWTYFCLNANEHFSKYLSLSNYKFMLDTSLSQAQISNYVFRLISFFLLRNIFLFALISILIFFIEIRFNENKNASRLV